MQTSFSRVFLIRDRASPGNTPVYQSLAKAGAISWPQGDVNTIRVPSETQYDGFDVIGKYRGDKGNPSMPLTFRYTYDRSQMLEIARTGCDLDVQVHMGRCNDPRDFNGGWEKIAVLEGAAITQYGTGDLGALQTSERALINEEIPLTGEDYYEIIRQNFASQAGTQITAEILDLAVCDAVTCGACGISSDGCQVVFAIAIPNTGSPGLPGEIIFTRNGGQTWSDAILDSFAPTESPISIACVGTRVAVTGPSGATGGVHYANTIDILNGTDVWTKNSTGLTLPTGSPRVITSKSPSNTWVFGAGGYIYFYSDVSASPVVQDAGTITTQQYNAASALDVLNVVAVGNSNVVVFTRNGGQTWTLVTGPAVGVNLNTVWMKTSTEWIVGTNGGRMFYTRDSGVTWTESAFTASGTGVVRDISFANRTVGYMTHDVLGVGYVLRTIDGGKSWYRSPEQGIMPSGTQRFNAVFACVSNPNVVFAGGLGVGTDGVVVKGA